MMETIVGLIIAFIAALWVHSDARKRSKSSRTAYLWFLGTFLLLIVFLPLWLITRPELPRELSPTGTPQVCIHCGKHYGGNPFYCPNCGHPLKRGQRKD
jgi:hypothetical protein